MTNETQKIHIHTLVPLVKAGSGLQFMQAPRLQNDQSGVPQLSINEPESPI